MYSIYMYMYITLYMNTDSILDHKDSTTKAMQQKSQSSDFLLPAWGGIHDILYFASTN